MYANTTAGKRERRSSAETVRLGREIYERDIRHLVEPDHIGKTVSIDVDTGTWAMDDVQRESRELLRKNCPEAVNVMSKRVGYVAVARAGFNYRREDDILMEGRKRQKR